MRQMSSILFESGHHQRWPQLWCDLQGLNLLLQLTTLSHKGGRFHRQLGTSCCTSLRNHEFLVLQLGIVKEKFISLKYLKGCELIVTCLLITFGVSLACFTDYTYLATHVKNLWSKGACGLKGLRLLSVGVALSVFLEWCLPYEFFLISKGYYVV